MNIHDKDPDATDAGTPELDFGAIAPTPEPDAPGGTEAADEELTDAGPVQGWLLEDIAATRAPGVDDPPHSDDGAHADDAPVDTGSAPILTVAEDD